MSPNQLLRIRRLQEQAMQLSTELLREWNETDECEPSSSNRISEAAASAQLVAAQLGLAMRAR